MLEHAAAAGAQHIPRQFEQAKPRRVQERRKRALFIEPVLRRKVEHIDATKVAVWRVADHLLDRCYRIGIRRLPQHAE